MFRNHSLSILKLSLILAASLSPSLLMADSFAHFIATTPDDRLVWHPHIEGAAPTRSILEQVSECVGVNRMMAALLRGGSTISRIPGPRPT